MCRPKNTVHYSLPEVKAQTPPKNLRVMDTKASANTLAEIAAEVEAKTMYKTMDDIRAETLVEVLYDTQAKKIEAETVGDTKGEVQKMSLPNTLAYMRA